MGLGGVGRYADPAQPTVQRKFNANPILAYYDIFKNYYSNKQEENAYVIATDPQYTTEILNKSTVTTAHGQKSPNGTPSTLTNAYVEITSNDNPSGTYQYAIIEVRGQNLMYENKLAFEMNTTNTAAKDPNDTNYWLIQSSSNTSVKLRAANETITLQAPYAIGKEITVSEIISQTGIQLQPFALKNIDNMRKNLLTSWDLGEEYVIDETYEDLPYSAITQITEDGYTKNTNPMQGLVVKCYQSDMFTNWLDSEWVAKVTEYSKVQVNNGAFSMDMLNLAKRCTTTTTA